MIEVSPRAMSLHTESVVGDAHNDLLAAVVGRPPERWAEHFSQQWLPQLTDGGVNVQVLPIFVDEWFRPEMALRQTLRMIECAHRIVAATPDETKLCMNDADIEDALDSDRIALILALESAPGLDEDIELFQTVHRLGVRIASLAHFGRSALADGSAEDSTGSRLTSFGVAAVKEMERIGMLVDLSHLGMGGVEHVLEISSKPLMATHSGSRSKFDHHRNLSDAQLSGIADLDGLVCVNFYGAYLHQTERSLERLIDHVEHMAGIVGMGRVGIGADFIDEVIADTTPKCCEDDYSISDLIPGLEGPRGLPLFTEALIGRGWRDDDIRAVLGANMQEFLVKNLH